MSREGGDNSEPSAKKKRGPYKRWLTDPTVPIPPSTVHSRELAALRAANVETGDELVALSFHQDDSQTEAQAENEQTNVNIPSEDIPPDQLPQCDTPSKEDVTCKARDTFIKKHHLKDKLHPQAHISKLDVLLTILHMAVRHCHTQHFIEDQIKFVNFLFGDNVLDVSYYIFNTLFTPSVSIIKHYFCVECEVYLGKDEDFVKPECPECKTFIDKSSNDFIVCPDCSCFVASIEDFTDNELVQCPKCSKNVDNNCKAPKDSAVCPNCKFYMTSKEKFLKKIKICQCPKCMKQIIVNSVTSGNYFITFSLREQIEEFLLKPGLKFVSHTGRDPTVIADICDGEFYRKLKEMGGPFANENALTITFNTDGVQVHESTQNDLYPIWYHVNEVVPEQRFKQENLLLAGLWFSKSAPNMSLFLHPFVTDLIDLSANGVSRILPSGHSVKCPVFPLMSSVDSVCKPKIVCQKQFNGKMGCLYCYHPNNTTVPTLKNQRFYDQEVVYKLRTDEEVLRDMMKADKLQKQGVLKTESVNGFIGMSVLLKFTELLDFMPCNTFSLVWGNAIDYMHAALEGVASDLFNIIANILTADQLQSLNNSIEKITPPQGMTRRPRSFSQRTYWKAKEFRAVLLYYILPCLDGVLADSYFENLKLFVNALHIFLSDSITHAQLSEAASCMEKFCIGYQRLYGIVNVSYNLHVCRHFTELVKRYGPLWCYSNFVFESGNGHLLNLIRGTKSVVNEIATKYTIIKTASKVMVGNHTSSEAVKFCSEILKCKYPEKNEDSEKAPLVLSHSVGEISENEAAMLLERNVPVSESHTVLYFNRVIRNGILYCSKAYSRAKVHDDSCVQLDDESFAIIDKFVKSTSEELLCIIKPIRIAQGLDIIPSIKRCCFDVFQSSLVIPFSNVVRKCFLVTVDDQSFVCKIPNFYERD